jgi:hypothetical protein
VEVAALVFDQPGQNSQPGVRRAAASARRGADSGHVMQQHLEIVQAPERVLDAFDRPQGLGARHRPALVGNLEGVPQLLRIDADLVNLLGCRVRVDRPGPSGNPFAQPPRALRMPVPRNGGNNDTISSSNGC